MCQIVFYNFMFTKLNKYKQYVIASYNFVKMQKSSDKDRDINIVK